MSLFTPSRRALLVVGLAFFTDMCLYYLLVPLLPAYARDLRLSQMGVGALFGSYAVALLLVTVPLGLMVDRVGRKTPMLLGLAGLFGATLLFAFSHNFGLLILARSLQGIAGSATWVPGLALLADHFPSEKRGQAMATCFAMANLGVLLGPPLSGFLAVHGGPKAPYLFGAGLVAVDFLLRLAWLEEVPARAGERIPWLSLMRDRTILAFAGALGAGAGLWALLEATLPLHLDQVHRLGPRGIGLCFTAAGIAHTITSPLMGRLSDRIGRKRVVIAGCLLCVLTLPLPAFAPSVPWVVASLVALGAAASLLMAPSSPGVADAVERRGVGDYGAGFSVLNIAYALGMMAGPYLGSSIYSGVLELQEYLGFASSEPIALRTALIAAGLAIGAYAFVVRRADERGPGVAEAAPDAV
jgi:multidrug resistance protein